MNHCPITYLPCGENRYSSTGLKLLSPSLTLLSNLEYTAEDQRREAYFRASKMSVQGMQPKLSAILNTKDGKFDIVDKGGTFILKPQHQFFQYLPENEDLTMKLAKEIGMDVPVHGLVWSKDGSLTYFIKRFDRKGRKERVPVEDFAQLSGHNRETKYNSSMEKVVHVIDTFCTFPTIEKTVLFKLTVFNFLVGNDDMHLKNFSLITEGNITKISPCYDLLNTTIEYPNPGEEIALTLKGRKRNLTKNNLIDYFGMERCGLTVKSITRVLESISSALPTWLDLINTSFLPVPMKEKYLDLLRTRLEILGID